MIHPGDWQDYNKRPDNKGLTVEELTYKYKQEVLIHENFNYRQLDVYTHTNTNKGEFTPTQLLSYPDFDGTYSIIGLTTGYYNAPGSAVTSLPRGPLTQGTVNTITSLTATKHSRYESITLDTTVDSITEVAIGDSITWQGQNSGASPNFNFVTNRNIPQDGTSGPASDNNLPMLWTSGAREYIFNVDYTNFEIVDIVSFIVP